jgi:hypothetical protein
MIYFLIITLVVLSVLIWVYTIKPLFSISKHLTVRIKEEIIPDIQKFLNLLTTLSSASIVLTFSFLQAFPNKVIELKGFLIGSWVFFGASILMGVTAVNFIFIYRAQLKVMIKKVEDHRKLKAEIKENDINNVGELIDEKLINTKEKIEQLNKIKPKKALETMIKTQSSLFLVMYLSSVSFFNAIVLLIIFSIGNV